MTFLQIYFEALLLLWIFVTLIWVLSVYLKNVSIIDIFWGLSFALVTTFYFLVTPGFPSRKLIIFILVVIWGLRLTFYLLWRNWGKPEDYRYQEFRKRYGENRYWWFSYFQVFLLQGFLVWLISAPLLAVNYYTVPGPLNFLDYSGIVVWIVGITFEAGGDWQLARFKMKPENKGKLLTSGLRKYTRHPNYFGDAAVWWGFALLSVAAGSYLPVLSSVLMTWLIIKVSGVSMLEKAMINTKPGFEEYIQRTSSFIPWFTKKQLK